MSTTPVRSTFWRLAGVTYNQYTNISGTRLLFGHPFCEGSYFLARTLRKCTASDYAKSRKFFERETEALSYRTWKDGKRGTVSMPPIPPLASFSLCLSFSRYGPNYNTN